MLLTLPASFPAVPSLPGKTRQSKLECLSQKINIDDVALFEKKNRKRKLYKAPGNITT